MTSEGCDCSIRYMKCSIPYKLTLSLLGFLLLFTTASHADDAKDVREPLTVVATTGMVADAARAVLGDRGVVIGIMGEGVDPHLYKPKASDVRLVLSADAVFYSGLKLEGRMGDVFAKARERGLPVHAVTAHLDESLQLEDEEHPGDPDPHIWMDVEVWSLTLQPIVRVLCEVDPAGCEDYRINAERYRKSLLELDVKLEAMIGSIPSEQRVLVTAHDAFRYFSRSYGIEVHGVQGISTESEPGLSELNDLVNYLVKKKIRAVFIESSVSPRNILAIIQGARAQGHEVVQGGQLYSDAMGAPGTPAGTYVGMMEHNGHVITNALGGKIPKDEAVSDSPSQDEDPRAS